MKVLHKTQILWILRDSITEMSVVHCVKCRTKLHNIKLVFLKIG